MKQSTKKIIVTATIIAGFGLSATMGAVDVQATKAKADKAVDDTK